MTGFEIIQPSASLSHLVAQYWFLDIDNSERSAQGYIPSGYTGPYISPRRANLFDFAPRVTSKVEFMRTIGITYGYYIFW